jgi:large subunit ribosomal protein L13
LSGDKMRTKTYTHHTGYPGGLKTISAEHLHEKNPTEVLAKAIKGMLPKNPLGKQMARKLKVYAGTEHPHQAQHPESLAL